MSAVLITGASSGIGTVYADRFARAGRNLVLVARRVDRLSAIAATLKEDYGVDVEILEADLSTDAGIAAVEHRIVAGGIDTLINNAGAGELGPTAVKGPKAQLDLIQLNIVAVVRLSLAALDAFRKSGNGTLVNVASVIAFAPSAGGATYSGTKAFVLNFTRSLSQEYAESAIRIQAVLPGPIATEFFTSQGLDNSIFPESAYITADQLVDAALAGLELGEEATVPTMEDEAVWTDLLAAQRKFLGASVSGKVASRYSTGAN